MSITRVRVVILVLSERGRQWPVRTYVIIWNGVVICACVYYVTNGVLHILNIKVHAEKMAFRRSIYFLKTVISCTAR